ncbi:hypothetical protein [Streptomyces sp. NPDC008139]|uniref:hypothetical protein n=1 Tax=Streptomyces sp. NPDC008139 TaxID=3364814 RepID=UPI0036E42E53
MPKAEAGRRAMEALEMVGLAEYADRPAPALSGGRQHGGHPGDCWDYHVRFGDTLLRSRMYREKTGLAHGDPVFVVPEEETAIAISLAGTPDTAAGERPVHSPT